MELLFDVLLGGLGYFVIKVFNQIFRTKVVFGDGGYIVTGLLFLVGLVSLVFMIFSFLRRLTLNS